MIVTTGVLRMINTCIRRTHSTVIPPADPHLTSHVLTSPSRDEEENSRLLQFLDITREHDTGPDKARGTLRESIQYQETRYAEESGTLDSWIRGVGFLINFLSSCAVFWFEVTNHVALEESRVT
jgi:hypothetical protein